MSIKKEVNLSGLQPELAVAHVEISKIYSSYGVDAVITSALDSEHKLGSLHYVGLALDYRIWNVPSLVLQELFLKIKEALGSQFDVVLEDDHIHVEFQPK